LIPDHSFMEKIKSHPYIKDRREVKPLIIRALRLLYDLELDENREMDLQHPLTRPR
jgi:kelch-like protein 10